MFMQDEWNVSAAWSVYAGIRWESTQTDVAGNDYAKVSSRLSVSSPILQTLWKFTDAPGWQQRFALTRTFKAPNKWDLTPRVVGASLNNSPVDPASAGNSRLRPELATGFDAAIEKFWDKGSNLSLPYPTRRRTRDNVCR